MHLVCPHCRNPIELVGAAPAEVVCPSCGSSFHLEQEATGAWSPRDGRRDLGRFELLDVLGSGAFGTVYKARDPELDRTVAVKVPRAGNLAGKEDLDRFLREGRSIAQLQHPSIVTVHEVGQHEGVPYLVSDFVQGVTLADLLTARRPGPHDAARLVAALAEALQYAHERGVVHRDVKPSNVILDDHGLPHLMDFGLAKRDAGEITVTMDGQVLGTPAYMSPEQAQGEAHQVDGRSDVYSLGVILYELLTGELPFRGNTRMLLHQVLHDEPRPPRGLNDRIPRDLETVCLKAMAKEPARRYQTAAELADDLGRFLRHESIKARPVGRLERSWRWYRRNPLVANLLAVVMFLLLAAAVGSQVAVLRIAAARDEATRQAGLAEDARQGEEDHRKEAEAARLREEGERKRAEDGKGESLRLLNRLYANNGARLLEEGDPQGALVWFAKALRRDPSDPEREDVHLVRLGTLLRYGPRLLQTWVHDTPVAHAEFAPDGRQVLTLTANNQVRVWDLVTGRPLTPALEESRGVPWGRGGNPYAYHPSTRPRLFSADGRSVVTVRNDQQGMVNESRVWDAATGQPLGPVVKQEGYLNNASLSADGSILLTTGGDYRRGYTTRVRLFDVAKGNLVHEIIHDKGARATFSPDGRRIFTHDFTGKAQLWDSRTGKPVGVELVAPFSEQRPPAFSPNGGRLLVFLDNDSVRVFDAATGQPVGPPLKHPGGLWQATFSGDGQRVLTTFSKMTRVWEPVTGLPVAPDLSHEDGGVREWASLSLDGRRALTFDRQRVRLWDVASGRALVLGPDSGSGVTFALFSPDGQRVLSVSHEPSGTGMIRVREVLTGEPLGQPLRPAVLHLPVAFSPDGRYLLTAGNRITQVWDLFAGEPLALPREPTWDVRTVFTTPSRPRVQDVQSKMNAWADVTTVCPPPVGRMLFAALGPDGRNVVTATHPGTWLGGGTARFWDTATGNPVTPPLRHRQQPEAVAISPDGRRLFTSSYSSGWSQSHDARVWDSATGRPLTPPSPGTEAAAFSPDGKHVLLVRNRGQGWSGEIQFLDAETGRQLTPVLKTGTVWQKWFSADGRRALVLDESDPAGNVLNRVWTVKTWDTATWQPCGEPIKPDRRFRGYNGVASCPDGRRLVTLHDENAHDPSAGRTEAVVWDVDAVRPLPGVVLKHDGFIRSAHFSPNGQFLLTLGRDRVRVWEGNSNRCLATLELNAPYLAAFSPNSEHLLTLSGDGLRVWQAATGRPLTPFLKDHPEHAQSQANVAVFSPDGRRVLTFSDSRARLWDVGSGQALVPALPRAWHLFPSGQSPPPSTLFSPDGRRLLTPGPGIAQVWDLSPSELPADDVVLLAETTSGRRLDDSGSLSPLTADELQSRWQTLQRKVPRDRAPEPLADWHRRRLGDCERVGEWAAAEWHLDRLLALEPGSGPLLARRGRTRAALGDWERAAADYRQALERGTDDAEVRGCLGWVSWQLKRWDETARHCTLAVERDPEDWASWYFRGVAQAHLGQKDRSAADCANAIRLGPPGTWLWSQEALLRLERGEPHVYRHLCTALLDEFARRGNATGPSDVNKVCETCLLAPDAVPDLDRVVKLAEKWSANSYRQPAESQHPGPVQTLGAALYRAGRWAEAVEKLRDALAFREAFRQRYAGSNRADILPADPMPSLFLAMACNRMGKADEARQWLDRAVRLLDNQPADPPPGEARQFDYRRLHWPEQLKLQLLRREAEALIKEPKAN